MSTFSIVSGTDVAGYCIWPWDRNYSPVVGCFVDGALQATAACNLHRAAVEQLPQTLGLRSRVKRRLLRFIGRSATQTSFAIPMGTSGTEEPVWFRLSLPTHIVERLRLSDPAVRLERLEDSVVLSRFGENAAAPASDVARVETLFHQAEVSHHEPLDGFASFLKASPQFQLEIAFVEYLRRLPEKEARDAYLPGLQARHLTVLDVRKFILASDEFKRRRVGYGSRLGASLTSGLWRKLAILPTTLEAAPNVDASEARTTIEVA